MKLRKIGFVQWDIRPGDIDYNLSRAMDGIETLGNQGVKLVLLPEMWSCSFDNAHLVEHAEKTPEILDILAKAAKKHGLVITGSLPERVDGMVYNILTVIESDGTVAGSYRKIHLFTLTSEEKYFGAGSKSVVCETSVGKLGLMVCYDLRFPELCRALALKGAEIVLVPAQWPVPRAGHWNLLLQARAVENQLFMLAANRCGRELLLDFPGNSQVVSPLGKVLVKAENNDCAMWTQIDFEEMDAYRKRIRCFDERVPEAYEA